jgi:hypothetical protein
MCGKSDKIEAEVGKLYAEREKTMAEARKLKAEAKAIEIQNSIRQLRLALECTKALALVGKDGEEAFAIGRQIDALIDALKAVAGA